MLRYILYAQTTATVWTLIDFLIFLELFTSLSDWQSVRERFLKRFLHQTLDHSMSPNQLQSLEVIRHNKHFEVWFRTLRDVGNSQVCQLQLLQKLMNFCFYIWSDNTFLSLFELQMKIIFNNLINFASQSYVHQLCLRKVFDVFLLIKTDKIVRPLCL